ncbi:MAG: hypothetical protein M1838_004542 [Thelocarpon superellum]|nr:MAG: hypothetical protein M1838_004542 [Thelocarpon superellum]
MAAFNGAVAIGAHAIETDIHLSKDGVVVLSHDATLQRCYGRDAKIIDCTWEELKHLRTIKAPHEPLPRLTDLLGLLATPGASHLWLLLDIKVRSPQSAVDTDHETTIRQIAKAIHEVAPSSTPWDGRIILGCWATKQVHLCQRYLPTFPITHIGFGILYARQFLKLPNVSFNMLQQVLMGPMGQSFIQDVKAAERSLFVWTVNKPSMVRWCIRHQVDGVIGDDPKMVLDTCDSFDPHAKPDRLTWSDLFNLVRIQFMLLFFGAMFWRRFSEPLIARAAIKSA